MNKKNPPSETKAKKKTHADSESHYQKLGILISLISIIASTALGIWAIVNNKKITPPILEYHVRAAVGGEFVMVISNMGGSNATNVTATLSIGPEYDVVDCIASSPFQDIQPINPYPLLTQDRTITYRIPSIPAGSSFSFYCKVYYTMVDPVLGIWLQGLRLSKGNVDVVLPGGTSFPQNYTCQNIKKRYIKDVTAWENVDRSAEEILWSIGIFADNSSPATQVGNTPMVSVWWPKEINDDSTPYDYQFCIVDTTVPIP